MADQKVRRQQSLVYQKRSGDLIRHSLYHVRRWEDAVILCCFVDSEQARKAVDCQVITQDLLKSGRREVAKKCTDDCVDLNRLQVYFSPDAWLKVQHLIAGVCKLAMVVQQLHKTPGRLQLCWLWQVLGVVPFELCRSEPDTKDQTLAV